MKIFIYGARLIGVIALVVILIGSLFGCQAPTAPELEPEGRSILTSIGGADQVKDQVKSKAEAGYQGVGKATSGTTVQVAFMAIAPIVVFSEVDFDLNFEVEVSHNALRRDFFAARVQYRDGDLHEVIMTPANEWPGYARIEIRLTTSTGAPLAGVAVDLTTARGEVVTATLRQPDVMQTQVCVPAKLVNRHLSSRRYDLRVEATMIDGKQEYRGFAEKTGYDPLNSDRPWCFLYGTQGEFSYIEFDLLDIAAAYSSVFASFTLDRDQFQCQRRSSSLSGGLEGNIRECDYTGETSSPADITFSQSPNDPDSATILVEEDDESDDYALHLFQVDVEGGDVPVKTSYITATISNPQGGESNVLVDDILDDVSLEVYGKNFRVKNNDVFYQEVADGKTVSVQLRFENFELSAGQTDVAVIASFGEAEYYDNGTTVSFAVTEDDRYAWQFDSNASVTTSGSTQGQTHTLMSAGLILNEVSSSYTAGVNQDGQVTAVTWTIEVEVTAMGDDFYAPSTDAFEFEVNYDGQFAGMQSTTSTADMVGDSFVVREGESEVFTLVVTLSDFSEGGYVNLDIEELDWRQHLWFARSSPLHRPRHPGGVRG